MYPIVRPRRLRRTPALRRQVQETRLHPAAFVLPLFVTQADDGSRPIPSMPGHDQLSVPAVVDLARRAADAGVGGVLLFGIPDQKDPEGTSAWDPSGPVPRAIEAIGRAVPDLVIWADVCLCEYTDHGHCGPIVDGEVDNDLTLPLLARAAGAYAAAGAHVVAPSDMMDGRVGVIRDGLDELGLTEVAICSYAAKYASAFYGPFRDAAGSAPAFGDRRTHQMDPANRREAAREIALDLAEGADLVMVKPAGPYLDVISDTAAVVDVPVVGYQVSGEYSMIKAADERGWIDGDAAMAEAVTSIVRAGADIVVTYAALDLAERREDRS
ncbi:MAG: porphobilinogen synthase [Acidimicrobiia bacterium]